LLIDDWDHAEMTFINQQSSVHNVVVVVAAVIERDGRFLVTRRQAGAHLEGYWEFPGGKCEIGETYATCLVREIREELGVGIAVAGEVFATTHDYPERRVELHFLRVELDGDPTPQMGQEMRWVAREQLAELPFPPADAELIAMLTSG
jgi:8-oxo-dGTP diphosphatase